MKEYSWFRFPTGFFETPEVLAMLKSERGKREFLFYIFLLCHAAGHGGTVSMKSGKPMPLSTVSLLFYKPLLTIMKYCKHLEKQGLVEKTDKGYYLPGADSLVGGVKSSSIPFLTPTAPKEEEDKEIEIDKKKEKDRNIEKAKAKEKRRFARYGNFDPEAVFAEKVARFQEEVEKVGGDEVVVCDG